MAQVNNEELTQAFNRIVTLAKKVKNTQYDNHQMQALRNAIIDYKGLVVQHNSSNEAPEDNLKKIIQACVAYSDIKSIKTNKKRLINSMIALTVAAFITGVACLFISSVPGGVALGMFAIAIIALVIAAIYHNNCIKKCDEIYKSLIDDKIIAETDEKSPAVKVPTLDDMLEKTKSFITTAIKDYQIPQQESQAGDLSSSLTS